MGIGALQGISDRWFSRADLCYRLRLAFARDNLASKSLYLDCGGQTYQGPIFDSKEAAEQHGSELCKDWIAKRPYCRTAQPAELI